MLNHDMRFLQSDDIPLIVSAFAAIGWDKPAAIYQKYLEEQENDQRCIWVIFQGSDFTGYVTLKWQSDYPSFRDQNIPEISDLNVLPKFRKQGVGSQLLRIAEEEAIKRCPILGIAVGLSADYGQAQRLYVKRGYTPDGLGVTSNNHPIEPGSLVRVDDHLVLWLTKELV